MIIILMTLMTMYEGKELFWEKVGFKTTLETSDPHTHRMHSRLSALLIAGMHTGFLVVIVRRELLFRGR